VSIHFVRAFTAAAFLGGCILAASTAEAGGLRFSEGQWRLTVQGMDAFRDAEDDRGGDGYAVAQAEYEIPLGKRFAMGLRVVPAWLYHESDDGGGGSGWVYGAGTGIAFRLYQRAEERTGWYGEAGAVVLGMADTFEGNSSHVNFKSDIGLGYQFANGWHAALKAEHISNAGLGDENDGVNGVGIAIGYRF